VDVTQLGAGTAVISVSVTNSSHTTQQSFNFTVAEVSRTANLTPAVLGNSAVKLTNTAATQVQLKLIHNGFRRTHR
jgi:hypothetical protein